jgi:hypothetical protein
MSEPGLTASSRHERALLERLEDAAAELDRAEAEHRRARELRDQAVRAALGSGMRDVAEAAGVSIGLMSRIRHAPRI